MDLFKSFILTITLVNMIYGLPTPQNKKLRPWETKETKEKKEVKSKVSNDKQSGKDYVDIPEDLYNAVKPITQYYFNSIKNLMNGKPAKSQKTKKISKNLFKAAVTPFTSYYAKHLKALQPLGSKIQKSTKTDDKKSAYLGLPYTQCLHCDTSHDFSNYDCIMCCYQYGIACSYPYLY